MSKDSKHPDAYVRKVLEDTQKYVSNLLGENERLRVLLVTLENEKVHFETLARTLRDELDQYHTEEARLQKELNAIAENNRRFSEQYMEVEAQNNNLANLYVASYRLHGSVERKDVVNAIREIITNLVGCEEFGIFEYEDNVPDLKLIGAMGIEAYDYRLLSTESGPLKKVLQSKESFVSDSPSGAEQADGLPPITACIPLVLNEKVTGLIVLFRLLPQKPSLREIDHELFNLLGTHAAMALYCAGLHAKISHLVRASG